MKHYLIRITAFFTAILLSLSVLFSGCSSGRQKNDKLSIVATLFPQYDFVRQVAGGLADVQLLLTPGTESHMYAPTTKDIMTIHGADLFIYTGDDMEPWAAQIVQGLPDTVTVLDVSKAVTLIEASHEADSHGEEESETHTHKADPHIWLDPVNSMAITQAIAEAIAAKDPANTAQYQENAANYKKSLEKLDQDFIDLFAQAENPTLVFGGRFAYIYFLQHYGVHYVTAYTSCSSEAEPSVKAVADVIAYVKAHQIPVIFHEELTTPTIAATIANETGAQLKVFSTCHNVTKDELESGITYIDIMYQNMEHIKTAVLF